MPDQSIKNDGLRPLKWFFFVFFAALFAVILWLVVTDRIQAFDDRVISSFIEARNAFLTAFFSAVTFLGDQTSVIILCVIVLVLPSRMRIGLPVALMTGVGSAVNTLIKGLVARPRPDMGNWLVSPADWIGGSFGYSFPSGHATSNLIFWAALLILASRVLILRGKPSAATWVRVICAVIALLIGVSRVYLGVHYPSDVFGGWLLAALLLIVCFALYDRFWPSKWRVRPA